MSDLKFCKDCKFFRSDVIDRLFLGQRATCTHPVSDQNSGEAAIRRAEAKTLVWGDCAKPLSPDYVSCWIMRKHDCGFEAKFFKPKNVSKSKVKV